MTSNDRTLSIWYVVLLNVVLQVCVLQTIIIPERPNQHLFVTAGTLPYDEPECFIVLPLHRLTVMSRTRTNQRLEDHVFPQSFVKGSALEAPLFKPNPHPFWVHWL